MTYSGSTNSSTGGGGFHCQIGERGENFVLPFQVSLVLNEMQRSGSLAKLAMVMAKVGDLREN